MNLSHARAVGLTYQPQLITNLHCYFVIFVVWLVLSDKIIYLFDDIMVVFVLIFR